MRVCCDEERSQEYDIEIKYVSEVNVDAKDGGGCVLKFSCHFPHNSNLSHVGIVGLDYVNRVIEMNNKKEKVYMKLPVLEYNKKLAMEHDEKLKNRSNNKN